MTDMFSMFGRWAREIADPLLVSGRRGVQRGAEARIVDDVLRKLSLCATDHLLDIGCGVGTLLLPLSQHVKKIIGVDHPAIIERLRTAPHPANCEFVAGHWLRDTFAIAPVEKIVAYSVVHYLASMNEVIAFITKALACLQPSGRLLIGDLPNDSLRDRFARTAFGQQFTAEFQSQRVAQAAREEVVRDAMLAAQPVESCAIFTDERIAEIVRHFRTCDIDAQRLPQPVDLPFGYTREDLLFVKSAK